MRIAANQRRLIEEFRRYVDDLERAGAELIAEYREANRSARPDGRTPEAHRKPWTARGGTPRRTESGEAPG